MLSKGIKLSYAPDNGDSFKELTDLQEIPELGGERDSVEVTTLAHAAHVFEEGLISYGDSIPFKFLYAKEQFTALTKVATVCKFKVELPDKTACTFSGGCSVKLDGVGVNAPLTYTLSVKPNSEMVWA